MMHRQSMEHEPAARSHVRLARSRRLVGVAAAAILVLIAVDEPTQSRLNEAARGDRDHHAA